MKTCSIGVESLESRQLLTLAALPAAAMFKMGWAPLTKEMQKATPTKVVTVAAEAVPVAVRETRAETTVAAIPARRIRPAVAKLHVVPRPADGITVPVLPGTTKTVELAIGGESGKTAKPLGVNVGSMTAYAQGNSINNLITQGGGFETSDGRIIVHTTEGSSRTTLVVKDAWLWSRMGLSAGVGQTLVGSTGANKNASWTITGMREQAGTGRLEIDIAGQFASVPLASDTFFVEATGLGLNGLANGTWLGGNTTLTRSTAAAHGGKASAAFGFGTDGNDERRGELTYYFGAEGGAGRNVLRQNHTYALSFWAKTAVAGSTAKLDLWQGKNGGQTSVGLTADGEWHQYTLNVLASNAVVFENGMAKVSVSGGGAGNVFVDDVKLVDLSDQYAPDSSLSKEVVGLIKEYGFGELRFWHPEYRFVQLDDLIGKPEDRQMVMTPFDDYDPQFGLPEMLQMAKETGTSAWIVLPTTWTNTDVHNLMEYLGGGIDTVYGAKRAADGHAGSWFADLPAIRLEAGNESWNGTFGPNTYVPFEHYWERAQDMFHAFKTDGLYAANASKLELVVNGWQWVPWYTEQSVKLVPDADAVSVSAYTGGPNTQMGLKELLGGVLSAHVHDDMVQYPQSIFGKKVYVYEEAAGELQGTITAQREGEYATSLGAGLAVARNAMMLQRDYGINTQNLFTMFQVGNNLPNGFALGHYGLFQDLETADTNPRPVALATKLLNNAKGTILSTTVGNGWMVDATSSVGDAATTAAADAMVTFDGSRLVVTLFNNTVADLQNTAFHLTLPALLGGKTFTADWANATFKTLAGASVGANNEAPATPPAVGIVEGKYSHSAHEVYAALGGHSMGSLVIPVTF